MAEVDQHVITIEGSSSKIPWSECTCGWKSEPTTELYRLGKEAFAHRDETGHGLRNL